MINQRIPVLCEIDAEGWRSCRKSLGMFQIAYIEALEGEACVENTHHAK